MLALYKDASGDTRAPLSYVHWHQKIGTISCMNRPRTSVFLHSIFVQSGGDSLFVFVGSLGSCGLSAGVGMAVPEAGAEVDVVENRPPEWAPWPSSDLAELNTASSEI